MSNTPLIEDRGNNNLAVFSMVLGIIGWVFFILLLCSNFLIFPLVLASLGLGAILYICLIPLGCLPPLSWIGSVITGHISNRQIKDTNIGNIGMTKAGLIMGYIGLGVMLTAACVVTVLILTGASLPFIESFDLNY